MSDEQMRHHFILKSSMRDALWTTALALGLAATSTSLAVGFGFTNQVAAALVWTWLAGVFFMLFLAVTIYWWTR